MAMENGPNLKMYSLLNMGIFQPAVLVDPALWIHQMCFFRCPSQMLQRLSCPWCEMMKVGGLFFEDFEQQSGVLSEFEKFRCLKNIEDIYFLFWSKYNMEAILLILLFKQELHLTLSQVNFYSSDSCQASIARVAKTHREGNTCKLSLKKKAAAMNKSMESSPVTKKNLCKESNIAIGKFSNFQVW